jgi:hypothetical protein
LDSQGHEAVLSELHRVPEEVVENLASASDVDAYAARLRDAEGRRPAKALVAAANCINLCESLHLLVEIASAFPCPNLTRLNERHVQQVVDQRQQMIA